MTFVLKFELHVLNHLCFVSACTNGILEPTSLQCGMADTAVSKPQDNEIGYLGEIEFVSSHQDIAGILTGFNKANQGSGHISPLSTSVTAENSDSYYQHNYGHGKACGAPKKIEDTILYKYALLLYTPLIGRNHMLCQGVSEVLPLLPLAQDPGTPPANS